MTAPVTVAIRPLIDALFRGELPVTIRCWDGSSLGPTEAPATIVLRSPDALRRLMYAPGDLGLGRAYVAGDLDVEGDIFAALSVRDALPDRTEKMHLRLGGREWVRVLGVARDLGALGRPLPPPPEEARLSGRLHSRRRDAAAVSHHYDVSNDFYRAVLGDTMTYSCAYFPTPEASLADAQRAKHELIATKLGLRPGMRLLDIGCGWGGMVVHAAERYDVEAVGVTVSRAQADLAAKRVAEAGLAGKVEIRLQDYRDVDDGPFDAISSIGMFEHVGLARMREYFATCYGLLASTGRMLNHAISRPPGDRRSPGKRTFITAYVFPDGELHEVGTVVSAMQGVGFEARDVQSLREHYALTLRQWVANLEAHWDEAVRLAGEARPRIWRLYMAASAVSFEAGRTNVHHVLGVKTDAAGGSSMPLTRPV